MFKTKNVKVYMKLSDMNSDKVRRLPEKNFEDKKLIRLYGETILVRSYKVPRHKVKDFKKGLINTSDVMFLKKKEVKETL